MARTNERNSVNQSICPVLIAGEWRPSNSVGTFRAENPSTGELLPEIYPVSSREEMLEALQAGSAAASALHLADDEQIATFCESYAEGIEQNRDALVERVHAETGLPKTPRLNDVELPRTTEQLRQAAIAAREGSWRRPILDHARKLYSIFSPLHGPVVVMGPNNFPFAFNSVSGGDFAAALVAHNPVIAKAHPAHPGTTRILAEIARHSITRAELHPATLQLLYHVPNEVGLELVSHPLTGATAFTGSRHGGLKLKAAADTAGKLVYLEMSSVNPVVILPGALRERSAAIAAEFFASCTIGAGQFCTNPGLLIVPDTEEGHRFVDTARQQFEHGVPGLLLGASVRDALSSAVAVLQSCGAKLLCGGSPLAGPASRFSNTLLTIPGKDFLRHPDGLQTEAFGPVSLVVLSPDTDETIAIVRCLAGNLTGSIYSDTQGNDDRDYESVAPHLRQRVGRLINNRMPTGVTLSPAMNHGGPFPATAHPGFTAVGIPTSVHRFTALHCYDNVSLERLPKALQAEFRKSLEV